MPKLDGFEVLKFIREDNPNQRVLILSARSSLDDKVKGLNLGANDYLTKPFHFAELEARIRAILRTPYMQNSDVIRLTSSDIALYIQKKQSIQIK